MAAIIQSFCLQCFKDMSQKVSNQTQSEIWTSSSFSCYWNCFTSTTSHFPSLEHFFSSFMHTISSVPWLQTCYLRCCEETFFKPTLNLCLVQKLNQWVYVNVKMKSINQLINQSNKTEKNVWKEKGSRIPREKRPLWMIPQTLLNLLMLNDFVVPKQAHPMSIQPSHFWAADYNNN